MTCTQVRNVAVRHNLMFSVFPQLILQSEKKQQKKTEENNRLSIILPHSPFLSPCVTGELFLHCLRNDSLLSHIVQQKKITPSRRGLSQPPPLPSLSHFTQICETVISDSRQRPSCRQTLRIPCQLFSACHPSELNSTQQMSLSEAPFMFSVYLGAGHFLCLFRLACAAACGLMNGNFPIGEVLLSAIVSHNGRAEVSNFPI